jgi:hypothetical protein
MPASGTRTKESENLGGTVQLRVKLNAQPKLMALLS